MTDPLDDNELTDISQRLQALAQTGQRRLQARLLIRSVGLPTVAFAQIEPAGNYGGSGGKTQQQRTHRPPRRSKLATAVGSMPSISA